MLNHEFSCQMRRLLIAFTQGKAILASTATSGNDLRHWPRSFQLCGKTNIRATHRFSKIAFAFFFLTRYHVLSYPSWKRSFARLRVSLLRKNKKMRGFFRKKNCWISAPSSSVENDHVLWMHFGTSHDAIAFWIFIRLFIWFLLEAGVIHDIILTKYCFLLQLLYCSHV